MADYTPSTEEVRNDYIQLNASARGVGESAPADEEWDRWFDQVRADAWDECVEEAYGRGFMHYLFGDELRERNPYRNGKGV